MKVHDKWLLVVEFKDSVNTKIPNPKVGEIKNSWTIIGAWIDPNSKRLQAYKVLCKCGSIDNINYQSLKQGKSTKCFKCSVAKRSKSKKEIMDKLLKTYDNSNISYPFLEVEIEHLDLYKITIKCKMHGIFKKWLRHQITGTGLGCPFCNDQTINLNISTTLYYVYFPKLNLWKIGITNKISAKERFYKNTTLE